MTVFASPSPMRQVDKAKIAEVSVIRFWLLLFSHPTAVRYMVSHMIKPCTCSCPGPKVLDLVLLSIEAFDIAYSL